MSPPLVSVVIPTFNHGHYVCQAVASVLASTYPHFEIIVIDDGSTDDTRERLREFGERIRCNYQSNAGLSAARNSGIRAARGELIAFLDADDLFHPRRLEIQVDFLQRHPEIMLVASRHTSGVEPGWEPLPNEPIGHDLLPVQSIAMKGGFGPSSVLVRRECFESVGYFDETLRSVEDRDMWIRIAARYPVARLRAALFWYRHTPGSMSSNVSRMEHYERLVLKRAVSQYPALKGSWFLRRRSLSLIAFSSAIMYREAGKYRLAVARTLESIAHWPFCIGYSTLVRTKFVLLTIYRRVRAHCRTQLTRI